MKKEVWVDISQVDNDFIAYMISNKGRICNKNGDLIHYVGNKVNLINRQGIKCARAVGLLVAKAFDLKKPDSYKNYCIRYKDGDIDNNCIDNLYWDSNFSNCKKKNVKLNDVWYSHLFSVENRYGSVTKAPNDDAEWQWVRNKAQGLI